MKNTPLTFVREPFRRLLTVGVLVLSLMSFTTVYSFNTPAVAASLYRSPIFAASSMANQLKDQVDSVDEAMMSAKDKLDKAGKKTTKKAQDIAEKAKSKAQKNIAKTKVAAETKAKHDIAKTQEAAEKTKTALVSRAQQDAGKADNALEKVGNKAEEFASNALDAAKNLIGQ